MPGSVVSGIFGMASANKQAKAAKQAAQAQVEFMRDAMNVQQRNLLPDRVMGEQAMFALADMMGLARPASSLVLREDAPAGINGTSANRNGMAASSGYAPALTPPRTPNNPYGYRTDQALFSYTGPGSTNAEINPYLQAPHSRNGYARFLPPPPQVAAAQGRGPQTVGDIVQLTPGLPAGSLAASPDYQYRFNEGLRAANTAAALTGMLQSGRQLKALTRYGQNEAAQEFNNRFQRLATIAGYGRSATTATNNAASSFGTGAATAVGSGINAAGEARASSFASLGTVLGEGATRLYDDYKKQKSENSAPKSGGGNAT